MDVLSSVKLMGARRRAGRGGEEAPVENVDQRRQGDSEGAGPVSPKCPAKVFLQKHTHTGSRQLWEMQRAPLEWKQKPPVTAGQRDREREGERESVPVRERERERENVCTRSRARERYQRNTSKLQMWWLKVALPTLLFKPTKLTTSSLTL